MNTTCDVTIDVKPVCPHFITTQNKVGTTDKKRGVLFSYTHTHAVADEAS